MEANAPTQVALALNDRQLIEAHVLNRLEADPAFRQVLLENPRAAIKAVLGVDVPADVRIHIAEYDAKDLHICIPAAPAADGELSDEQLESAAGGAWSWWNPFSWFPPQPQRPVVSVPIFSAASLTTVAPFRR